MSGVKGGHYGANEQPHKNPQRRIDALRVAHLRVGRRTRLLIRAHYILEQIADTEQAIDLRHEIETELARK